MDWRFSFRVRVQHLPLCKCLKTHCNLECIIYFLSINQLKVGQYKHQNKGVKYVQSQWRRSNIFIDNFEQIFTSSFWVSAVDVEHVNTRRVKMLMQMKALVGNVFSINTMEKLPVKDFAGHSLTKKQKIPTFYLMAEHAIFFFLRN